MKKFLSLIVMAIAFAIQLSAQTTVTIGDENSTNESYGPVYSYWNNNFTEVIYLASELQPGMITSISYQYAVATQLNDPSPVIYMAEVSRSNFANLSDFEAAPLTEVYSGAAVTYNQGWVTITLTTPFAYTGSGNLLVAYKSNGRSYTSGRYFTHTSTSDYMMIMNYSDSYATAGTIPTGGSSDRYMSRPNTRFEISELSEDFCFPIAGAAAQEVLADQATITWRRTDASSTTFGLDYKTADEEDWTTVSTSITDTFYTITGLTSLTNYDFRAYAVCPNENSGYSSGSFLTSPTEDDCLSIPFTETFDDEENVTQWILTQSGTNRWYIGTAENCSTDEEGNPLAGGSLYVSNNNGTSAAYDNSTTTYAYAYAYVNLEEDTDYSLQFDWKGGNDVEDGTIYDYTKVFLVPADYELPSTNLPDEDYALTEILGNQTDWTRKGIVISDIEAGFYKLVFLWFNDSMYGSAAGCVDNISLSALACEPVSSISVAYTDEGESVSAEVTVASNNDGASYVLEYRAEADAQWTELTGDSPFSISDLLYGTKYIFRATPVCSGGDYSVVSDPVAVYTPCSEVALPYYQGFEEEFIEADGVTSNTARPLCWLNINGGAEGYYFSSRDTQYPQSGTGALRYSGVYSSSTTAVISDWMISPIFNLTGNEQISYKIRLANTWYPNAPKPVIDVMICDVSETDISSMADTSRFTLVRSINHAGLSTTYEDGVAALAAYTGRVRVALAVRNATQSFIMDSVAVDAMPDCGPIYDLFAVASSESSIAVNYNSDNIGEAGAIIAYAEAAEGTTFDPESAATITVAQDEDLPVIISDLTPGATYYIAVKQACDGGVYTDAVTAVLPTEISITLPYVQNFDDTEAEHGYSLTGTGTNLWTVGTAANNTRDDEGELTENGRALYISNDNGVTAGYDIGSTSSGFAKGPAISFGEGNAFNFSFDYKVGGEGGCDYLSVYLLPYGAEPASSNCVLQGRYDAAFAWENFATRLSSNYANGVYQLLFEWRNDNSYGTQPGAIVDNIRIEALSCGAVSSVTATLAEPEGEERTITVNITDNNADLDGVSYVLKYRNSQDADYTIVSGLSASDFPYTINNVSHSTLYTIAVASVCSDGVQTAFVQTTVVVPCDLNQLPWEEHFYSDVINEEPACWTGRSGLLPASGTVQTSSLGEYGSFFYNNNGQNVRANIWSTTFHSWLITPSFDLGDGTTTYGLSFKAKVTSYSGGDAQAAPDDRFAVLISTDNGVSWDLANARIYADGDENTNYNYSDLFDEWSTQVVRLVDQNNDPLTGMIKIAFYGESTVSNGDNYFYIDDVAITEWNDCINPFNVAVSNITSTTADVTFNELGDATSWEYVLIEGANADLTSGTPVAFAEEDLPLQIAGLVPQTTYTLALRSSCGAAFSNWSEAVTFTTWATPTSLPYTTDFETEEDNSAWHFTGTGSNVWAIGTATFAGDEEEGTSAYISNDNGTSHAATIGYPFTMRYMWQDFDFGSGDDVYNLTFDWKCTGYLDGNDLYGGLVVVLQNQGDPMPIDGTFPDNDNIVALLYGENAWTNAQTELPQVSGEKRLIFLAFGYTMSAEATTPAAIDNISIFTSACNRPQNVTVSNITASSAEISWEGTNDSYIISYRMSSDTELTTVTVTSSPYTLTGLNAASQYIVAVQGVCGSETSIYSDAATFNTSCPEGAIATFPYTEGFEGGLNCWTVTTSDTDYPWTVVSIGTSPSCAPHSGSSMAKYASYSTDEGEYSTMISPEFSFSQDMQLSFWMYRSTMYATLNDRVLVYVNDEASEEGATLLTTVTQGGNDSWEEQVVTLPTGLTGSHYIIVKAISDYGANIYIDDITLSVVGGGEQPQPCDAPTALAVNNITQTTADFTWNGTASSYEVRLNGGASETVTTTSKAFTGLTANTSYTAEVRAVCESNNSAWVSTTFTTLADQSEVVAPTVATLAATSVTHNSAVLNGTITAGTEAITAQGFMYKATASADWTNVPATGTTLSATVSGLTAETEYQFKAFATTASGTVEGTTMTFTTTAAPVTQPVVTTLPATGVTHEVATLNGTVAAGTETITAQGFMYKAVTAADWTTISATGETMTSTITDLTAETAYEYKAFATTASGTVEGAVVNFTTLAAPATQPTVTTLDATEITHEAATLNGTIAAGTEAITAQGFMYKSVLEAEWTTVEAAGTTITATISGLTAETQYEYKAFATTASGTVEGNVVLFTTLANSGLNSVEGTLATMTVYPNPASERATIAVSGVESGAKIVVSDMQGRIILSDNMANDTYELSVDNLASGVYYIRVIDGNTIHTQKLIVK